MVVRARNSFVFNGGDTHSDRLPAAAILRSSGVQAFSGKGSRLVVCTGPSDLSLADPVMTHEPRTFPLRAL